MQNKEDLWLLLEFNFFHKIGGRTESVLPEPVGALTKPESSFNMAFQVSC